MVSVKIVKLVGETGLLLPGSLHSVSEAKAELWIAKGWAEPVEVKKERNEKVETKELKTKRQTKAKA